MSRKLTIETIAEDLSLATDIDGDFGYGLAGDGTITVETYDDEGNPTPTYTLTIDIKEYAA